MILYHQLPAPLALNGVNTIFNKSPGCQSGNARPSQPTSNFSYLCSPFTRTRSIEIYWICLSIEMPTSPCQANACTQQHYAIRANEARHQDNLLLVSYTCALSTMANSIASTALLIIISPAFSLISAPFSPFYISLVYNVSLLLYYVYRGTSIWEATKFIKQAQT